MREPPGEAFPTDYLPDEGYIHLFEPGREGRVRVSAGCVQLVEPSLEERNETLDWDFKHRDLTNKWKTGPPQPGSI